MWLLAAPAMFAHVPQRRCAVREKLQVREATQTGGSGTGSKQLPALATDGPDPLGSQDALILSADHRLLFASNAGDDTVTSFRVGWHGELSVASRVASNGRFPHSIASHGDLVYVANAGDPAQRIAGTIVGFRVDAGGALHRIAGAQSTLGEASSLSAHALLSPDGSRLIVSDLTASQIAVFPVHANGTLGAATFNPSAGGNPFGMIFTSPDTLLVTELQGGAPGGSSVSSYRLSGTRLDAISPSVASGQTAACWLSITPDSRFAYTSNTGRGNISIYAVSSSGALSLVLGDAVPRAPRAEGQTSGPVDSAITPDGHFLYQEYSGLGVVGAFRIGSDGLLTPVPSGDGGTLPAVGAEGLDGF